MAKIGLDITVTGLTGKLLIRWVEASAPLAEVGRSAAFNFPYDAIYSINNINPVVHIVQLWQSTDGVALTTLIRSWTIDASIANEVASETYQYLVGRGTNVTGPPAWHDPADLDTELTDERLNGFTQDQLYVVEAGYGPKRNDEYTLKTGGGIILTSGNTFNQDTSWFITVNKTVAQQTPTSTSSNQFKDVATISGATDFYSDAANNLYNKLVDVNGSATIVAVTFPALSLIPNFTRATFLTHDGTQRYLKLQFNAGDTVSYLGEDVNVIYVGRGAEISLFFKGGKCYVTAGDPSAHRVGRRFFGDYVELNTVLLDGTQYAQADVPRLMKIVNALPPAQIVTEAAWSTSATGADGQTIYPNKGKYAVDNVGGTVRVPDDRDRYYRALKFVDGSTDSARQSQGVGGYMHSKIAKHDHFSFNTDTVNGDGSNVGTTTYPVRFNELNGNASSRIKGSSTVPTLGLTSPAGGASNTVENTTRNTGLLPLLGI